jgi:altronate dehydratase small subunit
VKKALVINARDNVATALTAITMGETVTVLRDNKELQVKIKDNIKFGHKFALTAIAAGEEVLKYGEPIGIAGKDIASGQHVHTQNVESQRGRGDKAKETI